VQDIQEWRACFLQSCFKSGGAVAISAGPRLGAILVAASPPVMRILYSDEVEKFLPVRALFLQRRRAVADFDPARGLVRKKSRVVHVANVFSFSYRALAQCAAVDSF